MRIPYNNVGDKGIVHDLEPVQALMGPDAWSGGQNVRFSKGRVLKMSGHRKLFDPPSIDPYWVKGVVTSSAQYVVYLGLTAGYVYDGSVHTDISTVGTPFNATAAKNWNGVNFGGILVVTNGVDLPQFWVPSIANDFANLTNWPAGTKCRTMRSFKNMLMALNVTKPGGEYPTVLKWSSIAAAGSLPSSWDETDPTVAAGERNFDDTPGSLVDCAILGDRNFIYKEDAIWMQQFIGGINIFSWRSLTETFGIFSPRTLVATDKYHVAFGFDDVVLVDGRQVVSILEGRNRKWLFNQIDTTNYDRAFCVVNWKTKEVWVCIPEAGESFCTLALVWNWESNVWGVRELPDLGHVDYGVVDPNVSDATWDALAVGTWDNWTGTWGDRNYNPTERRLVGARPSTKALFEFDYGTQFDGVGIGSYVERTGLAYLVDRFGGKVYDGESVKLLKEIWPRIEGSGTVDVYAAVQDNDEGAIVWQGPLPFVIGTDQKVNPWLSGRFLGVKFDFTPAVTAELKGFDLVVETIGRYWG